ncbi:MAG: HAMP domain-containing protein [Candidatus Schekmanbacteria bacterium]|nr:HAMP domain-containing protein [Candidatus Schekmanbacteria bacterium]
MRFHLSVWFASGLFVLYALSSCIVAVIYSRQAERELHYLLYAQVESLAAYYAAAHRLDFPELVSPEQHGPLKVWVRLISGGRITAMTPGTPDLPVQPASETPRGSLLRVHGDDGKAYGMVRHLVWDRSGLVVEAIASTNPLATSVRGVLIALALTGLLLVPLALGGAWLVSRRATWPIERLVSETAEMSPTDLHRRLVTAVNISEIDALVAAFNALLGRVEQGVARTRRFIADASHELRTPVGILRTGIEIALRRERPAQEYRQVLIDNLGELGRLERLVSSLLLLARDGADVRADQWEAVSLREVVARVTDAIETAALEKDICFALTASVDCAVIGDPNYLELILRNLFDNALRFSPPGEVIRVELRRENGEAVLVVADAGPGVADEDRPHIFERFYRGHGTHGVSSGAGGLGLSLVRWAAELHGGSARLLDRPGVAGAAFEVRLPINDRGN